MSRSRNDRGRCPRCWVLERLCFCDALRPAPVELRIALVRHHKERWKTSNTGRLVALCCEAASVHDWHGRGAPFEAPDLSGPSFLLDPEGALGPTDPPAGVTLVVVDAAWKQVGRIVRFAPGLARLPRVAVPPTEPASPLLRRRVRPGGMSSAEAIAALFAARGEEGAATRIHAALRAQAEAILRSKGLSPELREEQLRASSRGEGVATPSDGG